ncbi:hypothetical protein PENARI_c192G00765 [Penicillium arizonense]|uniref:Uncharacterized protein n=2 Tax=Penicillium arizonense TaxID=1835702 RepID=A0A1F5KZZ2_PENAI|nr:hypothetical protein PENARI_c192G00765 [Penicillium arizonense]OGE46558.1 hypothetical protein PENARI_c192G00765 [Penicillium arizonense]
MIALVVFILSVVLVAIPVASRPLRTIMFTTEPMTPVRLPAHNVRRNHDLSSGPVGNYAAPSAKDRLTYDLSSFS